MMLKVTVSGPVEDEKHGTICTVDVYTPDEFPHCTWSGETWTIKTNDPFEALKRFIEHWNPQKRRDPGTCRCV